MNSKKTQYTDIWIEKSRLNDPMFWFMKAWGFASACHLIWEGYKEEVKKKPVNIHKAAELSNAVSSTPYLTGIALELFIKGYLIFKGEQPESLKKTGHNLKQLRIMCCKHHDKRFLKTELIFVTDRLGEQLMKEGGIRYPDVKTMPIFYHQFNASLKLLEKISGEVSRELIRKK